LYGLKVDNDDPRVFDIIATHFAAFFRRFDIEKKIYDAELTEEDLFYVKSKLGCIVAAYNNKVTFYRSA
jgi:hypothetical protein